MFAYVYPFETGIKGNTNRSIGNVFHLLGAHVQRRAYFQMQALCTYAMRTRMVVP